MLHLWWTSRPISRALGTIAAPECTVAQTKRPGRSTVNPPPSSAGIKLILFVCGWPSFIPPFEQTEDILSHRRDTGIFLWTNSPNCEMNPILLLKSSNFRLWTETLIKNDLIHRWQAAMKQWALFDWIRPPGSCGGRHWFTLTMKHFETVLKFVSADCSLNAVHCVQGDWSKCWTEN